MRHLDWSSSLRRENTDITDFFLPHWKKPRVSDWSPVDVLCRLHTSTSQQLASKTVMSKNPTHTATLPVQDVCGCFVVIMPFLRVGLEDALHTRADFFCTLFCNKSTQTPTWDKQVYVTRMCKKTSFEFKQNRNLRGSTIMFSELDASASQNGLVVNWNGRHRLNKHFPEPAERWCSQSKTL